MPLKTERIILRVVAIIIATIVAAWIVYFMFTPQFGEDDLDTCDDTASETIDPTLNGSVVEDNNSFAPCDALTEPDGPRGTYHP